MIESRYENFLGTDQVHHAMGNHAMRNHVRRGPSVFDKFFWMPKGYFFFFIKLEAATTTTTQHLKDDSRQVQALLVCTSFMALPIISFDCVNYYCERSRSKNGILHLSIFQAHIRNRIRQTET